MGRGKEIFSTFLIVAATSCAEISSCPASPDALVVKPGDELPASHLRLYEPHRDYIVAQNPKGANPGDAGFAIENGETFQGIDGQDYRVEICGDERLVFFVPVEK